MNQHRGKGEGKGQQCSQPPVAVEPGDKGLLKRRNIVAEILFPEMFPCLCAHTTFVKEAKFEMLLNVSRNISLPRQMFLRLRSKEAKHFVCFLCVCTPEKHFGKQCFPFSGKLSTGLFSHFPHNITLLLLFNCSSSPIHYTASEYFDFGEHHGKPHMHRNSRSRRLHSLA